eukprot:1524534-Pleurochrysis_carterae.AAC.1
MHCGAHAGQVAVVLPTSVLQNTSSTSNLSKRALFGIKRAGPKRAGPARQLAESVRVMQLLRRSRKQLILECITDKYDDAEGRPLTVAELVEKHQQMEEKLTSGRHSRPRCSLRKISRVKRKRARNPAWTRETEKQRRNWRGSRIRGGKRWKR